MRWSAAAAGMVILAAACTTAEPVDTAEPTEGGSGGAPVVVDTDLGPDDLAAIALLLNHPDIDVAAVTVAGTGQARCPSGVATALALVEQSGSEGVPVTCGASEPVGPGVAFSEEERAAADRAHGLEPPGPTAEPDARPAGVLIAELADAHDELRLVTLGPLTNAAAAVAEGAGDVEVVASLGDRRGDGFRNVAADPVAAARVATAATVTWVPPDLVASADLPTDELPTELDIGSGVDLVAALIVADETVADFEVVDVAPATEGPDVGQLIAGGQRPARQAVAFDVDRAVAHLAAAAASGGSTSDGAEDVGVEGELRWRYPAGLTGGVHIRPLARDGVVVSGAADGMVVAVDAADGTLRWESDLDDDEPVHAVIAGTADTLFVRMSASFAGAQLWALDAATGEPTWSFDPDRMLVGNPTVTDGVVYVGAIDPTDASGAFFALDPADGSEIWRADVPGGAGPPRVADGVVYVGSVDGSVSALDAGTGERIWRYATAGSAVGVASTPAVDDTTVYFGSDDGVFYAVDRATGAERWRFDTEAANLPSSPALGGDVVVFGAFGEQTVRALDRATGAEVWTVSTGPVLSSPAIVDGVVYVGDHAATLRAIAAESGETLWRFQADDIISGSPVVAGGIVFFQAGDLYAVEVP